MIHEIGFVAGDLWQYLDNHHNHAMKLSKLVTELGKPRDVIVMSVGWLAREGRRILEQGGHDYRVHLRRPSSH